MNVCMYLWMYVYAHMQIHMYIVIQSSFGIYKYLVIGNSTKILTPRIPHAIANGLCSILDISIFHEMLSFDPIRALRHDFLRVLQYFAIPPKLYKKSEAVVKLRELGRRRAT